MEVRRRAHHDVDEETKGSLIERVKKVDAFEKLPSECVNYTPSGGGATIITFIVISILIFSEINNFLNPEVEFNYVVDKSVEGELPINVDMTVAMKCSDISMDVVNMDGQVIGHTTDVKVINVKFELPFSRKQRFKLKREQMNSLREQHHSLHQYFWHSHTTSEEFDFRPMHHFREYEVQESQADACRFLGTFKARKAPGNLHVTFGRAFTIGSKAHIHFSSSEFDGPRNFSHRIHHLSFGTLLENYIHPLDAEEVISNDPALMYQYFVEVVPTTFRTHLQKIKTYQYGVTEQARSVNTKNQSTGVPGIFFRYDVFPMRVVVDAGSGGRGLVHLLVRLSAVVGGAFATGSLICFVARALCSVLRRCRRRRHHSSAPATPGLTAEAPLAFGDEEED